MKRYMFSGKILPERVNMSISPITLDLRWESTSFIGRAYISISWSQISISLDVESENDIFTMKNSMEHTIRVLVDSYGYISGCGYDIEITSVIDPNNVQTVFWVWISELENKETERPLSFGEIFDIAIQSKQLQYALFNLRESIRSPLDTGFFCYRAIEAAKLTGDWWRTVRSWDRSR